MMSNFRECFATETSGKVFKSMLAEIAELKAVRLQDGSKKKVWRLKSELQVSSQKTTGAGGPSFAQAAINPSPAPAPPAVVARPQPLAPVSKIKEEQPDVDLSLPEENEVIDLT
jgi:hypothetical protein